MFNSSFKKTIQFFQQINLKKCLSSIQCWDSNPQPLEHESPPITTSPGIPPKILNILSVAFQLSHHEADNCRQISFSQLTIFSVTRFGYLLNFPLTNVLTRVAQKFGNFLGILKTVLLNKNNCLWLLFCATSVKIG